MKGTYLDFRRSGERLHHWGGTVRSRDRGTPAPCRRGFSHFRIANAALAYPDAESHAFEIRRMRIWAA
jgi:hypothetical protein